MVTVLVAIIGEKMQLLQPSNALDINYDKFVNIMARSWLVKSYDFFDGDHGGAFLQILAAKKMKRKKVV